MLLQWVYSNNYLEVKLWYNKVVKGAFDREINFKIVFIRYTV